MFTGVKQRLDDILILEVHSIQIIEDAQRNRTAVQRRSIRIGVLEERIIESQAEDKGKRRKGQST